MKYKVAISGNKKSSFSKTGTSIFSIYENKDVIELKFDEDQQCFYATIINPSDKTLYLYNNNRLGITLCKLNTGKSQRKKFAMGLKSDEYGDIIRPTIPYPYVKWNYHPRWSRCNQSVKRISGNNWKQSFSNIEIPIIFNSRFIEKKIGIDFLKPNQQKSLVKKNACLYYTYIKATLISIDSTVANNSYEFDSDGYTNSPVNRSYKTISNRVGIVCVQDGSTYRLIDRSKQILEHHQPSSEKSGFSIIKQDSLNYTILFKNLSNYWLNCTLDILIALKDVSDPRMRHSSSSRHGNGPRENQHAMIHSSKYLIIDQIVLDSKNSEYQIEIPNDIIYTHSVYDNYIPKRAKNLAKHIWYKSNHRDAFEYYSPIYIQIRRNGRDSKMNCLNNSASKVSFNTNEIIDFVEYYN